MHNLPRELEVDDTVLEYSSVVTGGYGWLSFRRREHRQYIIVFDIVVLDMKTGKLGVGIFNFLSEIVTESIQRHVRKWRQSKLTESLLISELLLEGVGRRVVPKG